MVKLNKSTFYYYLQYILISVENKYYLNINKYKLYKDGEEELRNSVLTKIGFYIS